MNLEEITVHKRKYRDLWTSRVQDPNKNAKSGALLPKISNGKMKGPAGFAMLRAFRNLVDTPGKLLLALGLSDNEIDDLLAPMPHDIVDEIIGEWQNAMTFLFDKEFAKNSEVMDKIFSIMENSPLVSKLFNQHNSKQMSSRF